MIHTVVVALDFSTGSAEALVRAADLAERSSSALHLVHADVLFRSSGDGTPDGSPSSTLRVRVERFAAEALQLDAEALDRLGPEVSVVRDLTPLPAILRYTSQVDADLLVLGTHGRSGLARLLLGSVAEAVVAAAPCPVLTVPGGGGDLVPSPSAPVLVAVDFSERSRAALVAGRALAALFGAPVEVVHVVPDAGPFPPLADELSVSDADPRDPAVRDRLARFAESVPGPPVVPHIAYGAPSRVIAALATERRAGAIVMGTHGRTGLARIVGSVAQATLRRSPCPVLTLKEAERFGRDAVPVRSALTS